MASGRLADYLGKGLASARPATLDLHPEAVGLWYSTDTDTLSAWDGTTWQDDLSGGGLPDAPSDGNTYGRKDGAWAAVTGGFSEPSLLLSSSDELGPTSSEKLEGLPSAGTLTGGFLVYLVDGSGNSVKTTLAALKTFINTDPSVVPSSSPYKGARVYRTSDLASVVSAQTLSWQAASFDSGGFFSIGAPTRLTVPAGVTKVRLAFSIEYTAALAAGSVSGSIRKNGAAIVSSEAGTSNTGARQGTTGFNNNRVSGLTTMFPVVAGDYFELLTSFSMAGVNTVLANSTTWLEIEVIEAMP